ncbi:MAG: acyl-ACP--UDP-N-acetylglucosamine O-acyltransferase [Gemmatimonadota bacterium]|nr:MAG: acyl-ACP--UDP-N-acetylglucosamine O-acyltransferase [Gemmatimonadota bacterium]
MTTPTVAGRGPAPPQIHPTAIVDPGAELADGVRVGPYAIIGHNVKIGAGTVIGPHAYIEKDTRIGRECFISKGAVLGTDPQDLKYEGEETLLIVGDGTTIREFATLNRGTRASGSTEVGSGCLLMAYSHISHDSRIGDHVIIANAVNMGGHVVIENWATIGGVTAIHQFVRIGAYAFVGGGSRVPKDVAPFTRAAGNPLKLYGLNTVGLERRGFSDEVRMELKRAYRQLFNSSMNMSQAIAELRAQGRLIEEVERMVSFIEGSERGVSI